MKDDTLLLLGLGGLALYFMMKNTNASPTGGVGAYSTGYIPSNTISAKNNYAEPGTYDDSQFSKDQKTTAITNATAEQGGVGWQHTLKNYNSDFNRGVRAAMNKFNTAVSPQGTSLTPSLMTTKVTKATAEQGGVGWQSTMKNYNARYGIG